MEHLTETCKLQMLTWCHHPMTTVKVYIIISLPLTLELVMLASYAHRSYVCLMLCLWSRLGQWICHVQVSVHLAYLHISSINDLSDQVIAPQYMLGFFVRPRLLCLCNSTIIVTIEVIGLEQLGTTPNSETKFLIHIASEAAIYLASIAKSATVSCLELFQLTTPPLRQITYPDVIGYCLCRFGS